jgi:hypothetical protein
MHLNAKERTSTAREVIKYKLYDTTVPNAVLYKMPSRLLCFQCQTFDKNFQAEAISIKMKKTYNGQNHL